jgi:hypothetical protein
VPGEAGTVSAGPENWGTIPVDELVGLLETTTRRLQQAMETLAIERAHYWRGYWGEWQKLTPTASVAAKTRECELRCAQRNEHVIVGEGLVEALRAKRDGLVAALGARP